MRVIEGRGSAYAHEFLGVDRNGRKAFVILEMRNGVVGHIRNSGLSSIFADHIAFAGVLLAPVCAKYSLVTGQTTGRHSISGSSR